MAAPSREAADQAVDVVLHDKARVKNLVINQVASEAQGGASARGSAAAGAPEPESWLRRRMWWLVAIATIVGAVATLVAVFH